MLKPPLFKVFTLCFAVFPRVELETKVGILLLGQLGVEDAGEGVVLGGPLVVDVVEDGEVEADIF